ncbi:peptidase M28 [Arcticibacterium luteifluviistationis]|uniref:Peptidase M28 n=2 Tax=Arcticibacterium luteifluviistationis TaxID=1784714 RepID=A0A2Z4GIS6_9BACT|nr:peptidase M28 [Arcticibacterium luteifluviistationis]
MKNPSILFILLCLLSVNEAISQDFSKIYAETITTTDLRKHLEIIASDDMEGRETTTKGQYKAAIYLADQFENLGLERIVDMGEYKSYFQWFDVAVSGKSQKLLAPDAEIPANHERRASMNILGFLPGKTKKEEVIIISAHYDHIGIDSNGDINNGADDDGSGTAAVLEIAEAFVNAKKDGHGPERSILFLLVAGEEKGLLGSKYYTDYAPVIPLPNTVCDLNIDMIGRKDEHHDTDEYVYLIGADKLSSDLDKISKKVNKKYINYELDYTYNDEKDPNRFYYRSDHYNFAKNNIPVIFFFTGVHEDYHKPGDDIEKIIFPKYSYITKLIFHTAWEVANRTERLKLNR